MPTQAFEITRAPEAPPLEPEVIRRLLWYAVPTSEWDVWEVVICERCGEKYKRTNSTQQPCFKCRKAKEV